MLTKWLILFALRRCMSNLITFLLLSLIHWFASAASHFSSGLLFPCGFAKQHGIRMQPATRYVTMGPSLSGDRFNLRTLCTSRQTPVFLTPKKRFLSSVWLNCKDFSYLSTFPIQSTFPPSGFVCRFSFNCRLRALMPQSFTRVSSWYGVGQRDRVSPGGDSDWLIYRT